MLQKYLFSKRNGTHCTKEQPFICCSQDMRSSNQQELKLQICQRPVLCVFVYLFYFNSSIVNILGSIGSNIGIRQSCTQPSGHHDEHSLNPPSPTAPFPSPTSLLVTTRLLFPVKDLFFGLSLFFLIFQRFLKQGSMQQKNEVYYLFMI